ncbi:Staygreen protein [uncultured virus]|nr:Staygreen protein [uncultured virus]
MSGKCVQCTDAERSNQHRLKPLLCSITYESSEIIGDLSLPRKYTSVYNDETSEIYLSIGHKYNKHLLSSEEAHENGLVVTGKWIMNDNKYVIHLKVHVNTKEDHKIICSELGVVLEGIAFAESALLEQHSNLGNIRILVHFKSVDEKYDRVENWHRLKYWTRDYVPKRNKISSDEKIEDSKNKIREKIIHRQSAREDAPYYDQHEKNNEEREKEKEERRKRRKQRQQRRPPQMCAACRK